MHTEKFEGIGADLIKASKESKRTSGEMLQELFPYVYEAARRMSARQISRWLEENHGIQISQPTISRALRNPKAFEDWFTENIEPTARRVSSSLDMPLKALLLDSGDEASYDLYRREEGAKEILGELELKEVEEGLAFLNEKWFSLSIGTRRACFPAKTREEWEDERANDGN